MVFGGDEKHCLQGRTALDKQDKAIAAAMTKAFTVKLGGRRGAEQLEMGCCLGVIADAYLSSIRSSLGSALAEASDQRGLRPMGVVAYFEVCAL